MAEPALKTRYEDHYGTASASPEENTGTIIGTSDKGPLYTRLSFTGEQGLRDAELIYGKTGALPHRLREAMGAAQALQTEEGAKPVTIRTVRVGEDAAAAELVLLDADTTAAITITVQSKGTDGNAWSAMVEHEDETRIVTLKRSDSTTTYQFEGDTNQEVVDAINASSIKVDAVLNSTVIPADLAWTDFTGGLDGTLTYAEVVKALQYMEQFDDRIILVGGANTAAARSAIGAHNAAQLSDRQKERFAIFEGPAFDDSNARDRAAYLIDMQAYVDALLTEIADIDDRNVIQMAGDMTFLDAEGEEYNAPVAAAALGAWLTKSVDRSMVNIRIPNAQALVPPFEPSMRNSLADGRVVYARTEVGRGIIIANSKTLAATGSDFAKAQDLRTVYTCGAEARAGGMVVWGKSDDAETNDGLRDLEEAMSKPLRLRVGKSITGFDMKAEFETGSTTDVVATMGVTPRNSMEKIDHVVVIRRAV